MHLLYYTNYIPILSKNQSRIREHLVKDLLNSVHCAATGQQIFARRAGH